MSRRKIYTTVGVASEVYDRIESEAHKERRSKSFIIDKILRAYFHLPWAEEGEKVHANKA